MACGALKACRVVIIEYGPVRSRPKGFLGLAGNDQDHQTMYCTAVERQIRAERRWDGQGGRSLSSKVASRTVPLAALYNGPLFKVTRTMEVLSVQARGKLKTEFEGHDAKYQPTRLSPRPAWALWFENQGAFACCTHPHAASGRKAA